MKGEILDCYLRTEVWQIHRSSAVSRTYINDLTDFLDKLFTIKKATYLIFIENNQLYEYIITKRELLRYGKCN